MKNSYRIDGDVTYIDIEHDDKPTDTFVIDTEDLPLFESLPNTWCLCHGYPRMQVKGKSIYAHILVMRRLGAKDGLECDHVDSVRTNCRKSNLQAITHAANTAKVTVSDHTYCKSGFRNVYRRRNGMYRVMVCKFYLGTFDLETAKAVAANYRALVNFQRCVLPTVL